MSAKNVLYVSSLLILPVLYALFYALHVSPQGHAIEQWLPRWDRLLLLVAVIGLERVYTYRYAVSQRSVLARDVISNVVNLYITGAVAAFIILPALLFLLQHSVGRKVLVASPEQLGPLWFQVVAILLSVSLFRYWMHRWQHNNEFLWALHSYHHRVTDLKATNAEVSNPIDFALRNIVVFLVLGVIGFDPFAILITVPATNIIATFSHCGGDVRGGFLNYLFVTPEVHRWHHSAHVPEGRGYSVNYGVEFAFWDVVFGTYYLPQKDGQTIMPERIGHPDGLPDEGNYLKVLLAPLGLYRPLPWFKRAPRLAGGS
ncbi:MAG TPA: sterol desaturase family protein [Micropepsaceae bacterium]|nr:sterol desaturase family protein [Micropepsaceae bacterium]